MASLQLPIYDCETFCIIGYTPQFEDEFKFRELNKYKWHKKADKLFATNEEGKTIYFNPAPPVSIDTKIEEEEEIDEEKFIAKKMYSKRK